jgi:hypothetical protein
MYTHSQHKALLSVAIYAFLQLLIGCDINDVSDGPDFEYRQSFNSTSAISGRTRLFISNVNGAVAVFGVDTLTEVLISGSKIVRDQTVDEAQRHINDIQIDIQESSSTLTIKTSQPNSSGGRTYQVDYEIMVPSSWEVTVTDVNGSVEILNIRNTVAASVVNGTAIANDIAGSVGISVTNGTITGKVFLPETGSCTFDLVNGNATLLVPRTTSATVSATVTNGSVSVTNLPIVFSTNSRTSVSGVVGGGKGTIRLSSVNGIVQLLGF